jgi:outer membrane protein assembly factor BamA
LDKRQTDAVKLRLKTFGFFCSFFAAALLPATALSQETRCDEGDVEVRNMSFSGNTAFTDAELTSGIVTTPSSRLRRVLRIVGTRRCLDQQALPLDVLRLTLWYRNHGFHAATVDTVVASLGKDRVEVRFLINEGEPMRIDTLRIEGLDAVPERATIVADLPVRVGGWFDRYGNAATRDTLTRRLRDNGYPDAEAFLGYDTRREANRATVIISVTPGPRRRIGAVNIVQAGRDGSRPKVSEEAVRRLAGVETGDLYRERSLERAKRTLYQTEAFSQVIVEPGTSLGDSSIAVDVEVTEGYLRTWRLGPGWGSLDCFRTTAELTDYNAFESATRFELRGRLSKIGIGQPLTGAESLCPQAVDDIYSRKINYYLGATISQPALLRRSFVPSLSLYSERRSEYNAFLRTTHAGAALALSLSAPRRLHSFGYTLEFGKTEAQPALYCAVFNACEAADRNALQQNQRLAVLSASSSYERTDDAMNPRRGIIGRAEVRHASDIVGAEASLRFTRLTLDGSAYAPLGRDIVLAIRVRAGIVLGQTFALGSVAQFVPPQERLFAGGPTTVRGFRQNELGPAVYIPTSFDTVNTSGSPVSSIGANDTVYFRANPDSVNQRAVPTGGNTMIVGNAELRIVSPIFPSRLTWTLFADIGETWNRGAGAPGLGFRELKMTPGIGLRIRTPIGYLRADLAYNPYERSRGAAYYDAPVSAGGALFCVSPGNSLPIAYEGSELKQGAGACPATFIPSSGRGFFGRWTPSIAIGQAF